MSTDSLSTKEERALAFALANFIDADMSQQKEDEYYSEIDLVLKDMYSKFPFEVGRLLSRQERKQNNYLSGSLIYGEILSVPYLKEFTKLYHYGLQRVGGKFVDIGCGTGLALFASALAHDFETCIGIEILDRCISHFL